MLTMSQKTLQDVMADSAVDTTLTMVADMVGVTKDMASKILESGLPMLANVADEDPWVFKATFAQSITYLAPPTSAFYTKLGKDVKARQAMAADYEANYGPMTETITRDAAQEASATEQQASQVLAATMPVAVKALGKANTNRNEMGFGRQLRNLSA
jgi:hypothetical protein